MENYVKDVVIEDDNNINPFDNYIDNNVIHMKVKNGTKIKNIVDYSIKNFVENSNSNYIVLSGSANGSQKTISCAEIIKRFYLNKYKTDLFQMTKIFYKSIEEFWKPIIDNLDVLKVVRKIPTIYILLSKQSLNPNESGFQYQDSIQTNHFINKQEFNRNNRSKKSFKSKQKNNSKTNTKIQSEEQFEEK
jgi:ribonuclease P/MRP protein subunit RPP25